MENNSKKSSVIDLPRKQNENDLFGIKKYQDALIEFIENSNTPLTIALQGEWGSGKTSLMNQLENELCDKGSFYRVWINSWQYSLMKTPGESILKIVEGMIEQILKIQLENTGKSASVDTFKNIFRKFVIPSGKFIAKQIVDTAGGNADFVDDLFGGDGADGAEISQMKKEIEKLIKDVLENGKDKKKKGFLFFIDDLDRIDPPVAVQILELLKNIFDLDKCIFVLAIDYDVVIKGLEPKFGKLTDKNEREFRSFFDKIIQLPFSMPIASYTIDKFLIDALRNIDFINEKQAGDIKLTELLSTFASLSVGQNPRTLKRLTNTLSLINIINKKDNENRQEEDYEKSIGFAMVCLQIAYPLVYNLLIEDSDFIKWDEKTATKLNLEKLQPEQIEKLNNTQEFNDSWEKILFQMCQKETFTRNRVFYISQLLNIVKELIPIGSEMGLVLGEILEQSAVTNLLAFDKQKVVKGSKKENINYLQNFSSVLIKEFAEYIIPTEEIEINKIKGISNNNIFSIPIKIDNYKFKDYIFRFMLRHGSGDGLYFRFSLILDGATNLCKDNIFDKVSEILIKNGMTGRTTSSIAWKRTSLHFNKLTDKQIEKISSLENQSKNDLINEIANESKKFITLFKETMEADK
jgi:hypothetical protein